MNVPYYSQRLDIEEEHWRGKACTIANIKMLFDYYSVQTPSLAELIDECFAMGGFGEHGWIHEKVVQLARNYGLPAYRQEFRSSNPLHEATLGAFGIKKICESVSKQEPVIVSVRNKFTEGGGYHTILLIDCDAEGFIFHDSDADRREKGEGQKVDFETFKKHWRNLAIFVEKGNSHYTQKT